MYTDEGGTFSRWDGVKPSSHMVELTFHLWVLLFTGGTLTRVCWPRECAHTTC